MCGRTPIQGSSLEACHAFLQEMRVVKCLAEKKTFFVTFFLTTSTKAAPVFSEQVRYKLEKFIRTSPESRSKFFIQRLVAVHLKIRFIFACSPNLAPDRVEHPSLLLSFSGRMFLFVFRASSHCPR